MGHIFLSDVHLGAFKNDRNQQLENELIRLVDYCQSREIRIYILGDFFDCWMEFPNYIPELGRALLDRFEQYNDVMGYGTTYITGNHDYWTESHFEERGFRVEHEHVSLKLGNSAILLCHGDGLQDEQFQLPRPLFHRFIRDPRFVRFYKKILTGKAGFQLMKTFSSVSRNEKNINTNRLSKWAKFMLKKSPFDVIISGHDHVPRMETFPGGTYINTGAFHRYKTVIEYKKETFKLVTWCDDLNEFKSFSKPV